MDLYILLTVLSCLAVKTCQASIVEGSREREIGSVKYDGSRDYSFGNEIKYWIEQLGDDASMPKAITDSLRGMKNRGEVTPRMLKDAGAHVGVGPINGVHVNAGKHKVGGADVLVNRNSGVHVNAGANGKGGANVAVTKGGIGVNAGTPQHPVFVGVRPGLNPFDYQYVKPGQNQPARRLFFLEKNLKPRHQMTMHLPKSTNGAIFLPRDEAELHPFSSSQMKSILEEFGVDPGSEAAQGMEETVEGCERKGIEGEDKYCATSLESMIDYAISKLGKKVRAVSTEAREADKEQKYTISGVRKMAGDDEAAVCHKQSYVYAVFYCHKTRGTSAYMVSLRNENGSRVKAMAICHKDTSAWNPKHMAFQFLKETPGGAPICHFLPEDHVVWVRN